MADDRVDGESPRSTSTTSGLVGDPTPSTSMGKVSVSLVDDEFEELLEELPPEEEPLLEEDPPLDDPPPDDPLLDEESPPDDPLLDDPPLEEDPPPEEPAPLELELPCDEDPPEEEDDDEDPCAAEESCVELPLLPPHAASCKASKAVGTVRERRRIVIP